MLRSTFFTLGLFVLIWGVTFVLVDRVLIAADIAVVDQSPLWNLISSRTENQMHEISPPDWAAFGMMAVGTLTMLYSLSLPKKQA